MKLATSYFYQIRFFKPYMIPFSTAVWDPKWYHDFKDQSHNFVDNNGVLNGLRIRDFRPGDSCSNLCRGPEECYSRNPNDCLFLTKYREQLEGIDINKMYDYFNKVLFEIKSKMHFVEEPMAVLIVHEAPTKLCSERGVILDVLQKRGVDIHELSYPIHDFY